MLGKKGASIGCAFSATSCRDQGLLMAAVDQDGEELTRYVLQVGKGPPDLDREALQD